MKNRQYDLFDKKPKKIPGLNFRVLNTRKKLIKALNHVKDWPTLTIDTETSGLNPYEPGGWITSLGFGNHRIQYCLPLQHPESRCYNNIKLQKAIMRRVHRAIGKHSFVAQNGKFDTKWIRQYYGYRWPIWFDTMLAHYMIDENNRHALDLLSQRYFGAPDYDIPLSDKHGLTGTLKDHCKYLALDILYTSKLFNMTYTQLQEDESTDMIFWSHTMPMANMYADIEHNGVFLDLKKLDKAQIFWSKREAKFLKKLNSYLPNDWEWKDKKTKSMQPGINWESPKQIGEAFEELGIKSLGKTKTGQAKTDVATLKTLSRKHKVCKTILDYREATKTLNTFIESWQEKNINGYIHPTFKVHGTVTGRPSCEKPNLQQTKRDPRIRSIITAPPGWTFIEADYSQAELRIMAEMSDDPELTLAFVNGLDVHVLTCQRILGLKNPTKDERKKAKAINFGFIYGMGCKTFIEKAWEKYEQRFSMTEAKKIKKGYFQLYRKVTTYHERQERFGRRNGYVRSILGRKRRLPALLEGGGGYNYFESVRQAINAPIQGFVSDLNLMSAIELHNKLNPKEFRIVGTVHDNILMEIRNDCLEKIIPEIVKTMEDPKLLRDLNIQLRIPLVSDLSYGPWSKGKKWVPGEKIIIE